MIPSAKRENLLLLLLGVLTVALLLFPVRLRVGMDWYETEGRLSLVMSREAVVSSQPQWPKQRLDLVLPGNTYLHLRSLPASGRPMECNLAAIRLGEPGAGVPPKGSAFNLTMPFTELDLAAYSYPRLLGYVCAAMVIVALIRRGGARRRGCCSQPACCGTAS